MVKRSVDTFSVVRKKIPFVTFTKRENRMVNYFSKAITEHFSMSEELAKAIGTVVVQALTENAKDEAASLDLGGLDSGLGGDDFDLGDDDEFSLDESDLPESAISTGEVEEAEGPKNAPDLSSDFAELKKTVNSNHSIKTFAEKHNESMKEFFSMRSGE